MLIGLETYGQKDHLEQQDKLLNGMSNYLELEKLRWDG